MINERKKPPFRRNGYTQSFKIEGHKFYLRTGEYEDGTLCEIFLDTKKEGTVLRGYLNAFAISVSIGLQYGIPITEYAKTLKEFKFPPSGEVTDSGTEITKCNSFIDCIMQDLVKTYGTKIE